MFLRVRGPPGAPRTAATVSTQTRPDPSGHSPAQLPLCAMLAELADAAGLSPAAERHPSSRLGHRTSRNFRDVAKQVRPRAHNAAIVGSNPTITTTMPL